jgi:hypothetical protein
MNPARTERAGRTAVDPTVQEFLERTQGVYRWMQEMARGTGAERIVTMESGDVNLSTIWAMHGGDSRIQFLRDQSDIHASLKNVRKSVELKAGRSAVLVSAPEMKVQGLERIATVGERLQRAAAFGTGTSVATFIDVIEDPDIAQVVLIAREEDGGIAFADRWLSLASLPRVLSDVDHQPTLILVTNGGFGVERAFSDTGRFGRVLTVPFVLGHVETFEAALTTIASLLESTGPTLASLSKADFAKISARAGSLGAIMTAAAKGAGDVVQVDIAQLLAAANAEAADVVDVVDLQDKLANWIRTSRQVDLDTVTRALAEKGTFTGAAAQRKARAAISALVQTKYD